MMRVGIAGAGAVGRSVARELVDSGHRVLLIERNPAHYRPRAVPEAEWLLADACELSALQESGIELCDVVIAATGDDRVNLAAALLAKAEFGVPRVVARVNDAGNEWLFTESWGVDVAVCAPRVMAAAVEGALDVGHLVWLMGLRRGQVNLTKMKLVAGSPLVGKRVRDVAPPENSALVTVLRDDAVMLPSAENVLAVGDELLFAEGDRAEQD